MDRVRNLAFLACLAVVAGGCDGKPNTSSASGKPWPQDYRVIAECLGRSLRVSADEFRNNKDTAEIIAEGHAGVMDLRKLKSNDSDINYIASQGASVFADAVLRFEKLNSLPKPQSTGSLMVESFLHGLYGNVYAAYALGVDAENKQKAILAEVEALAAAAEKADGIHLLLPKVAEKYAAPISSNSERIVVDFDESWGAWGPYDWCRFYNGGGELNDCTVLVELKGAKGDVRRNVHYVRKWPGKSWLYARYDPGTKVNERWIGRMTVYYVQTVKVTLLSSEFSTKVDYTYAGAEKDKDVAERCKGIKLSWRYQPFVGGIIWDTQRAVKLTLADYPWLGQCTVAVNFKRGEASNWWHLELDQWKEGEEKTISPPAGGLTYDPDTIEIVLSFPHTNHKLRWEQKVGR